jgi:hypothetical protein
LLLLEDLVSFFFSSISMMISGPPIICAENTKKR